MSAVLAPQKNEAPLWPLSVAAYHALGQMGLIPEKTELLYGFVYHKMPKSPAHRLLFMKLLRALMAACPDGFHVQPEQPITCADSEPEPDLSLIRGEPEDYAAGHPTTAELVAEICMTSHDHDRSKLAAYASAGVKEVWLVLGPERQVEVYRQPEAGRYSSRELLNADATLASPVAPALGLKLTDLFPV